MQMEIKGVLFIVTYSTVYGRFYIYIYYASFFCLRLKKINGEVVLLHMPADLIKLMA